MFIGEFSHTIDAKGRVNIPAKFREQLGEVFYVTKGLDKSLFVFPEEEWQIFVDKLKNLPLTNPNARSFVRIFYSGASECSFDKQGRILITQPLREYGGLEKDVRVIGVGTRIEIWSVDNWEKYNSPDNLSYEDLAEHMADLGI